MRRTISWKDGLMCDKRTPLGDFKLSQDKVCYDVRNGARVVGNNDTLVISLEITMKDQRNPRKQENSNSRSYRRAELLKLARAITGRAQTRVILLACKKRLGLLKPQSLQTG
jgi:hypothetical protein